MIFLNLPTHNARERKESIGLQGKPNPSNLSIQMALDFYNIEIPSRCNHPVYVEVENKSRDRAIITLPGWIGRRDVLVYRGAFLSWGVLASTLAHELEIHCKQSTIEYILLQGLYGTKYADARAEIPAYDLEISRAKEYGTDKAFVDEMKEYRQEYVEDLK